jgi:hypothetical protein
MIDLMTSGGALSNSDLRPTQVHGIDSESATPVHMPPVTLESSAGALTWRFACERLHIAPTGLDGTVCNAVNGQVRVALARSL